jgi:PAS domain S-box-containing protein
MPPAQPSHSLKILLADDSASVRMVLSAMLAELGHEVAAVADGAQAVERFQQQPFDMALLDGIMPQMDGFEATARIKALAEEQKRWVPILIISASEDQDAAVRGLDSGAEDFLYKPVHPRLLEAKIDAYARSLTFYRRLVENEQRAQAISDGVVDAIISIDEHGIILSCNPAAQHIFGYEREELLGQNISLLMPEPLRSLHDSYITRYLQTSEAHVIGRDGREVVGLRKDGSVIDLRMGVSEIRLPSGQRVFIGVLGDISQQKAQAANLRENAEKLARLNEEITNDMDIATAVMDKLIFKDALHDAQLHYHLVPARQLSGDLAAAVRSSNSTLYIMLADATGHGLAAAISLLPALWVFYGMARKNATVPEIAAEINSRLKETVPVGRFVAAHIATINNPARTVRLWSGGMPPAYFLASDGQLKLLHSPHLALGILPSEQFDPQTEIIEWRPSSHMLFCSDGLTEAQNPVGEMFSEARLQQLLAGGTTNTLFNDIVTAVEYHLQGQPSQDDISLLSVLLP